MEEERASRNLESMSEPERGVRDGGKHRMRSSHSLTLQHTRFSRHDALHRRLSDKQHHPFKPSFSARGHRQGSNLGGRHRVLPHRLRSSFSSSIAKMTFHSEESRPAL
eukprot:2675898-Rhodomonas_salina.3